ncbi:eosinophil peroxidase-like isoform X2 [Heptranchias perlo]|uniref:eosinophil peroxidase-like isoform X2 n=2 Tax=Heptranchias perlo TaxID=212740 RepID=UPI00355A8753
MMPMCFLSVFLAGFTLTEIDGVPTGSEKSLGSPFVHSAVQEAIKMVDRAYKESRDVSKEKISKASLTPSGLLIFFKQPTAVTRTVVRAAECVETAMRLIQHSVHRNHQWALNVSELLTLSDLNSLTLATGCSRVVQPSVCKNDCWSNRYRTINSNCNNRRTPHLGTPNMPFARWLPAQYEDGFSLPKGWIEGKLYSGFPLPLVREVSNKILKASSKNIISDSEWSQVFVQWGQWINHEITFTPVSGSLHTFSDGINCESSCVQRSPCFPIKVPCDDPRTTDARQCIPFIRSAPACNSVFGGMNIREQINAQTTYIDASVTYGNVESQAKKLRDFTSDLGLLMVNPTFSDNNLKYLPFRSFKQMNPCAPTCTSSSRSSVDIPCMLAGDSRANENLGLLSFHTIFLREHNRLARELKRLNPHWSGETIYQEARKIMGAFQQIINYRDYVPLVIGKDATEKYLSQYRGYNESVDPRLANVFTTAALRFGHVTIQPIMKRYNEKYQEDPKYPSILLHHSFFTPWKLIEEGGIDPIFRGLFGYPAKLQTQSSMMPDELRDKLFALQNQIALDLSAINIQRSRDHGLQGYNAWRRFCGLSEPQDIFELSFVLNNMELATNLLNLYGTPDNIDVWVGGISEPFVEGGRVGPLFACLIGQQFKNLRDGDRFWWESQGFFTASQQQALQQISFSTLICDNTRIDELPRDAFRFRPYPEGYVGCNQISRVNLSAWREKINVTPCGSVPVVAHAHFSICKSSVRYTCESGLKLEGGDTITCLSDGLWNSAPPACTVSELCGTLDVLTGSKGGKSEPGSTESKEDTADKEFLDGSTEFGSGAGV